VSGPLREQIARARASLVGAGLAPEDAAFDAEVLARHVLSWDRAQLLTRWHLAPPDTFPPAYDAAIARRAAREPVALITGHREFWGLDFHVTRDVLIPRPETELIVEQAIARCAARTCARIVDVGTGSGCIAVALGHELPSAHIIAIDCSMAALEVAARNVARHGMTSRVQLVRSNLLDAVAGPVDLIVSNPPYIARRDAPALQPEVMLFEPETALFADEDGFAVLRVLCDTAGSRLAPGGLLIVEFGAGYDAAVCALAQARGWTVETASDLAGIPRVAAMSRDPNGGESERLPVL
jgi:release factor glutamine methyltransferase